MTTPKQSLFGRSYFTVMRRITDGVRHGEHDRPKKAGEKILCLKCRGVGYTREGLTRDYPVECDRCQGTGKQTVRPR